MIDLSKFASNKKILSGVTLFQVTPGIILSNVTPINIFQLNVNFDKSTIRLYYLCIFSIFAKF